MKTASQGIGINHKDYTTMLGASEQVKEDTTVELDGGKYKAVIKHDGGITVYRHGEEWQDCTGNNLVYWLIVELAEARSALANKD